MKTITIRDLRQRWPEAEAALQVESEILITRDAKPVAKLISVNSTANRRRRWDANAHARWQQKMAGGAISSSDVALAQSRAHRVLAGINK